MTPYDPQTHGPKRIVGPGFHAHVHELVRAVPAGAVTTYGDVGIALGSKNIARHVGYAMAALPDEHDVPWWRVVGAGGRLSPSADTADRQATLLRKEGVEVRKKQILDFNTLRHVFESPNL